VNTNHYLYLKSYYPSIGINGELQCFIKRPQGIKTFLRSLKQLQENSVENFFFLPIFQLIEQESREADCL